MIVGIGGFIRSCMTEVRNERLHSFSGSVPCWTLTSSDRRFMGYVYGNNRCLF